jgi:hypothetical protein
LPFNLNLLQEGAFSPPVLDLPGILLDKVFMERPLFFIFITNNLKFREKIYALYKEPFVLNLLRLSCPPDDPSPPDTVVCVFYLIN